LIHPKFKILDDAVAEILRPRICEERLAIAGKMWLTARNTIKRLLRADHPEWGDDQVRREIRRRMLGPVFADCC
jgi:hypothetical protein